MIKKIFHISIVCVVCLLAYCAAFAQQSDECDSIPNYRTNFRAFYDSISKKYEAENGYCLAPVVDSIAKLYLSDIDRMQYLKLLNKIATYSDGGVSEPVQDAVYKMLDKNDEKFLHDIFSISKNDSVNSMLDFIKWAATCPDPNDCAIRKRLATNLKNDIKAGKLTGDELAFRQRVVDAVMK